MLNALKLEKAKEKWKEIQMNKLSFKVGLMFASKPIMQLIANPFIGPLTNRLNNFKKVYFLTKCLIISLSNSESAIVYRCLLDL